MRRSGIVHPDLMAAINRLHHTDRFVVADAGLPVPRGVEVIDLAVVLGLPRFVPVLTAILDEVVIDGAVVADELAARNPAVAAELDEVLRARDTTPTTVSHEELKAMVGASSFVVRTGEATPYANVVLRAGVPF